MATAQTFTYIILSADSTGTRRYVDRSTPETEGVGYRGGVRWRCLPPPASVAPGCGGEGGGQGGSIALSVGGSLRTPTAAPSEMAA
jgi:hypothetical protein